MKSIDDGVSLMEGFSSCSRSGTCSQASHKTRRLLLMLAHTHTYIFKYNTSALRMSDRIEKENRGIVREKRREKGEKKSRAREQREKNETKIPL